MGEHDFPEPVGHKEKMLAIEIAEGIAQNIQKDKSKLGSLLCEGLSTSIDVALYRSIYPYLVVIPANGCTDVIKLLPRVKKYSEYPAFGIIDRDNRSKRKIKQLASQDIFATKLPFIENIICCPEVLKVISREYGWDYEGIIARVRSALASILVEKLSFLNPFNIELPKDTEILNVKITITAKERVVEKNIDLNNVMYTFRDKMIANEVAQAIGLSGKDAYYKFIEKELSGKIGSALVFAMSKYLPTIKYTEE